MDDRELAIRQRLKDDFEHYAARCLHIRTKTGSILPFTLNRSQLHVHERLEAQRKAKGRVRALVLKARQWGCSTYVEGRFYWQTSHSRGIKAYILTHLQDATDNLFGMVQRFHENCPELVRPHTGTASAKELYFDLLDSGYKVATAGSKSVGRSDTIQRFHGSEVAHWPHADQHMAGVMQAVPDADGTEIILESTANGVGGMFYDMCIAAEAGDGTYELIFVPWFWHEEYVLTPPEGWQPTPEWSEYGGQHELTHAQLYWAWSKNRDISKVVGAGSDEPCWLFRQEYPANVNEAFQAGGVESLIRHELVFNARRNDFKDNRESPLVLGVDVARGGGDKTRIIDRCGRRAGYVINRTIDTPDLMEVAGQVAKEIDRLNPARVFIDATGGYGSSVCDRLKERGYGRIISPIEFGGKALDPDDYSNRRAEIWGRLRDWFALEGGVDILDDSELHRHICAPGYKFDSDSRLRLESKDDIRKRVGFSPDGGDALALTFAETVRLPDVERKQSFTRADSAYNPHRW